MEFLMAFVPSGVQKDFTARFGQVGNTAPMLNTVIQVSAASFDEADMHEPVISIMTDYGREPEDKPQYEDYVEFANMLRSVADLVDKAANNEYGGDDKPENHGHHGLFPGI